MGGLALKRSAIKPKGWPFEPRPVKTIGDGYTVRPRAAAVAISDGKARMAVQVPKQKYVRDGEYLRWVASLPCAHCGIEGRSQAAHSDDNGVGGKGMGIKAYPWRVAALCPQCHVDLDSGSFLSKQERRDQWDEAHRSTIGQLFERGKLRPV